MLRFFPVPLISDWWSRGKKWECDQDYVIICVCATAGVHENLWGNSKSGSWIFSRSFSFGYFGYCLEEEEREWEMVNGRGQKSSCVWLYLSTHCSSAVTWKGAERTITANSFFRSAVSDGIPSTKQRTLVAVDQWVVVRRKTPTYRFFSSTLEYCVSLFLPRTPRIQVSNYTIKLHDQHNPRRKTLNHAP